MPMVFTYNELISLYFMYVYVKLVISTVLYMVVGLHDVISSALGLGALLGILLAFYYILITEFSLDFWMVGLTLK